MSPPSAAYTSHLSRAFVSELVGAVAMVSPAIALIDVSFSRIALPRGQEERIYAYMVQRIEAERDPPGPCRFGRLAGRSAFRGKIGRRDVVQKSAQSNGSLITKGARRLSLRILPALEPGPQPFEPRVRQSQLLAATVRAARLDADQSVAFERQDVSAERGPVHHHLLRQRIDRHRPVPPQAGQNGKLGRAQPNRGQMPVVKLRDVPRRLADGETGALFERRQGVSRHFELSSLTLAAPYPS